MPDVVMTLSPFLMALSISCTFLRCRCCGRITRKYMMPNISISGMRKPPSPEIPPPCQIKTLPRAIRVASYHTLSRPCHIESKGFETPNNRRRGKTSRQREVPAYPARPILLLRVDLPRVATGLQENPANRAIRIRLDLQHSGLAALMRNWIVVQKK